MSTAVKYQGRTYQVESYVDPYPGRPATDRIFWDETCPRCGGTGLYTGWSILGKWQGTCFCCGGGRTVERSRAVSTFRREARVDAVLAEYGDEIAAETAAAAAAEEAARLAEEIERAWNAAHAEKARREAMNNRPAGTKGERLRDLEATVTVSTSFERTSFSGYGTDLVKVVCFELASGQVLKAMGTATDLFGLKKGDTVKVTGTVKSFDEFRGQHQTVIARPKVEIIARAETGDEN